MPQTSTEVQRKIDKLLGPWTEADNGYQDQKAIEFLEKAGYKLTRQWQWIMPNKEHKITEDEALCLAYLVEEWDFGDVIP